MDQSKKPNILNKLFEYGLVLASIYGGASSITSSDTQRLDEKMAIIRSVDKIDYLTGKYNNGHLDSITRQSFYSSPSGEWISLGQTSFSKRDAEFENYSLEIKLQNKSQRLNF